MEPIRRSQRRARSRARSTPEQFRRADVAEAMLAHVAAVDERRRRLSHA